MLFRSHGIVAGVPAGVKVAHKFGEGTGSTSDNESVVSILNDCGIVYKKDHPYIICIMTEGTDFSDMEKVLGRISRTVYEVF